MVMSSKAVSIHAVMDTAPSIWSYVEYEASGPLRKVKLISGFDKESFLIRPDIELDAETILKCNNVSCLGLLR